MITTKSQRIVFRFYHVLNRSDKSNSMRCFVFLSDTTFEHQFITHGKDTHTHTVLITSHTLRIHLLTFSNPSHQDEFRLCGLYNTDRFVLSLFSCVFISSGFVFSSSFSFILLSLSSSAFFLYNSSSYYSHLSSSSVCSLN